MVNLIVDYRQGGADLHQAFVASWTDSPTDAAKYLLWMLRRDGCTPVFISTVAGDYTPEQLRALSEDPGQAHRMRLVWLDPVQMQHAAQTMTREERRIAAQALSNARR